MRKLLILLTLLLFGCSAPPKVPVVRVSRADLVDTFREQAETSLRKTYLVRMPAAGRIGRIELEPGDPVRRGQHLVRFDRMSHESEVREREAEVEQLRAELALAANDRPERAEWARTNALLQQAADVLAGQRVRLRQSQVAAAQAEQDLNRVQKLYQQGFVTRSEFEQAQLKRDTSQLEVAEVRQSVRAQAAIMEAARRERESAEGEWARRTQSRSVVVERLAQAQERLLRARHEAGEVWVDSPISGFVVQRLQQGPGPMAAGEKLLELGRLEDLEVMAEVLTSDALRLRIGGEATVQATAGGRPLKARVRRVEPAGYTKLSSLGVEQKRVRVYLGFDRAPAGLGVGYRLEAQFVVGRRKQALALPRQALLQRPDGSFFVFCVEAGRLQERPVKVGMMEDLQVEIAEGLQSGETVVSAPDSSMKSGMEVNEE